MNAGAHGRLTAAAAAAGAAAVLARVLGDLVLVDAGVCD